jgi:hypothetical protein
VYSGYSSGEKSFEAFCHIYPSMMDTRASAELRLTTVMTRGVISENRPAERAAQNAHASSIIPIILEFTPTQCGSAIKQMAFAFPGQILNPENGQRKVDIAERLDPEISGDIRR